MNLEENDLKKYITIKKSKSECLCVKYESGNVKIIK